MVIQFHSCAKPQKQKIWSHSAGSSAKSITDQSRQNRSSSRATSQQDPENTSRSFLAINDAGSQALFLSWDYPILLGSAQPAMPTIAQDPFRATPPLRAATVVLTQRQLQQRLRGFRHTYQPPTGHLVSPVYAPV